MKVKSEGGQNLTLNVTSEAASDEIFKLGPFAPRDIVEILIEGTKDPETKSLYRSPAWSYIFTIDTYDLSIG